MLRKANSIGSESAPLEKTTRQILEELKFLERGTAFEETFGQLNEQQREAIYRVCYRVLGHVQDAEDATQDTLCNIYRYRQRFRPGDNPQPWLYVIASNAARSIGRVRSRYHSWCSLQSDFNGEEWSSPQAEDYREPAPDTGLLDNPEPEAWARQLVSLTEGFTFRCRVGLFLRVIGRVSESDAVRHSAIPPRCLGGWASQARKKLRAFGEELEEAGVEFNRAEQEAFLRVVKQGWHQIWKRLVSEAPLLDHFTAQVATVLWQGNWQTPLAALNAGCKEPPKSDCRPRADYPESFELHRRCKPLNQVRWQLASPTINE